MSRFLKVFNSIISSKKPYISACLTAKKAITDTTETDAEMNDLPREVEVVAGLTKSALKKTQLQSKTRKNTPHGTTAMSTDTKR